MENDPLDVQLPILLEMQKWYCEYKTTERCKLYILWITCIAFSVSLFSRFAFSFFPFFSLSLSLSRSLLSFASSVRMWPFSESALCEILPWKCRIFIPTLLNVTFRMERYGKYCIFSRTIRGICWYLFPTFYCS